MPLSMKQYLKLPNGRENRITPTQNFQPMVESQGQNQKLSAIARCQLQMVMASNAAKRILSSEMRKMKNSMNTEWMWQA